MALLCDSEKASHLIERGLVTECGLSCRLGAVRGEGYILLFSEDFEQIIRVERRIGRIRTT